MNRDDGRRHLRPDAHRVLLCALILVFTAASIRVTSSAAYVPRFVIPGLLVFNTIRTHSDRVSWKELPRAARWMIGGSWGMFLVGVLSVTWSIAPITSAGYVVIYGLLVLIMTVLALFRWHDPGYLAEDVRLIFWTLVPVVAASAAVGTVLGTRLVGLFENPNTLGIVGALAAALGAAILRDRFTWPGFAAVTLVVGTTILTGSRDAVLGILAASIFFVPWRRLSPSFVVSAAFTGAACVTWVFFGGTFSLPAVFQRIQELNATDGLGSRAVAWQHVITLWQERPWRGYGFRAGEVVFQDTRGSTTFAADVAHSSYLQQLLELGIAGLIPGAVIVVGLTGAMLKSFAAGRDLGLGGVVVVGLVVGVGESALFGVGSVFCWGFWLGATAASLSGGTTPPDPPWARRAGAAAACRSCPRTTENYVSAVARCPIHPSRSVTDNPAFRPDSTA